MGIGTELGCMMIAIVPQRSFRSKIYISVNGPHEHPDYTANFQFTWFSKDNWYTFTYVPVLLPVA